MRREKMESVSLIGCIGIALVYLFVLAKLVIFKYGIGSMERSFSVMPFQFVLDMQAGGMDISVMLKNVLGNIGVFIPLGILLPVFFQKNRVSITILEGFLISLIIEVLQYVLKMGILDVDDMLLNTAGVAIGAVLFYGCSNHLDRKWKNRFGTVGMLCLLGCISAGTLYYFGYGSELTATPIYTKNEDVLEGLEEGSEDYSLQVRNVDAIAANQLLGISSEYDEKKQKNIEAEVDLALTGATVYYSKTMSYDYSPNGNIRSMTVSYAKISQEQFQALEEKEENIWTDVWSSDGKQCDTVMVTIHED